MAVFHIILRHLSLIDLPLFREEIDRDYGVKVQTELARRKQISRQYSGKSIFSSRIVCGDCGSYFGSKVWNSTSKYRRVIWQCNSKFQGGKTLASY